LDLIALENISLNNAYPNDSPLIKTIDNNPCSTLAKTTSTVDASLSFLITKNGIDIRMKNSVSFKGLQVDFKNICADPGTVTSSFGNGFAKLCNNSLRVLVYSREGAELIPGDRFIARIPVKIDSASSVAILNLVVVGGNITKLENLESQINLEDPQQIPIDFALGQNYPNPFNPNTSIIVAIPKTSQVSITIYNLLGQEVRTLFAGQIERGTKILRWDGKDSNGNSLASGTYVYRMQAGSFVNAKKMILLK
jgi:hypothetical protein